MWIINKLKLFIFFIFSLSLLNLSFSANLNIQNDLITDILRLTPQDSSPECSSSFKGRLYYNSNDKQIYYCDGASWQVLEAGGKDTAIGSAIIASSSADALRAEFVCDGTDDQEEIQQAIDYLNNTGGAVYLLEGTYNLSDKILFDGGNSDSIDDSNKSLIGTGAGSVLSVNNEAIQAFDISRIIISQLNLSKGSSGGENLFKNISYSILEKLSVSTNCTYNLSMVKSNFNIIIDNFFHYGSPPLFLYDDSWGTDGSSYNIIYNNIFTTGGTWGAIGIFCGSSNNIAIGNIVSDISASDIIGSHEQGIWIFQSSYNIAIGNIINRIGEGIVNNAGSKNNIFNSNILSNLSPDIYKCGIGFFGTWGNKDIPGLIFSNNIISEIEHYGILLDYAKQDLLLGNILYNTQKGGVNVGHSNDVDNNLIFSNYIYASFGSGYGISIKPNSDNNYLVGNFIGGSGYSQPINDEGNNTRYTDKIKISLEPGEYTGLENGKTLTPQGSTSYLRLTPSSNINLGNPNIASGKTKGDILIIENAASGNYYVRFKDGQGVELEDSILVGGKLDLYPGDVLIFVWNGSSWVEIGYSDN